MEKNLGTYRKSYDKNSLTFAESAGNPFDQFATWFKEVEESKGVEEVNAVCVSTIGQDGFPKSRIVLLKEYDEKGFVFYTNYNSEKGRALLANPRVCLSFFWPNLERQVIIRGTAQKLTSKKSTKYFHSRPRGSQLGAWVSPQSEVIPDRESLENRERELTQKYADKEIPRPEHWGGFLVKPYDFEFWQGRPNRLHDRIRFTPENQQWKKERLAP